MELDDFRGVYSTRDVDHTAAVPTGGHKKRYWLVWDGEGDTVIVQPLSRKLEPVGAKSIIAREELLARFSHEPVAVPAFSSENDTEPESWSRFSSQSSSNYFEQPSAGEGGKASANDILSPSERDEAIQRAVRPVHRQTVDLVELDGFIPDEEEPSAEDNAANEAEHAARADFAMAQMHLKKGESHKAMTIFRRLAKEDAPYREPQKHMFTDFGIALRKNRLFDVAVEHHQRAHELSPRDDHVCHNIARCYYENGDMTNAMHYLKLSLELNPVLTESIRFMAYIRRTRKGTTSVADI